MLKSISLAIAALAWSSFALAGSVETTPSISLEILSIDGISNDEGEIQFRDVLYKDNAKSTAKMNAFEQRISGRAQRVVSSICYGCLVSRNFMKVSALHLIVNPTSDEMKIDDPAQASLD